MIGRDAKRFFVDFEVFGSPAIEPRIRTDASGSAFVFIFSQQGGAIT